MVNACYSLEYVVDNACLKYTVFDRVFCNARNGPILIIIKTNTKKTKNKKQNKRLTLNRSVDFSQSSTFVLSDWRNERVCDKSWVTSHESWLIIVIPLPLQQRWSKRCSCTLVQFSLTSLHYITFLSWFFKRLKKLKRGRIAAPP